MAAAHHTDKSVAKQGLHPHLGAGGRTDHTGFQIHTAVAQRAAVLMRLGHKTQPHAGGLGADTCQQAGTEVFDKPLAGAQGEGALQLLQVDRFDRAQHHGGVLHQLAHLLTQRQRTRCGHQAPARAYQQRVTRRLAQARQRPAHGRRAEPQTPGGACHAAFGEQHVQRDQQVQIGEGHGFTIAEFAGGMAFDALIKCKCCAFRHGS